jgi:mannosylglycerate synthase
LVSLCVFPFKAEPAELVVSNLAIAASHPAVDEVWAIAPGPRDGDQEVRKGATDLATATGKPVVVLPQDRIGSKRPGKGDAMNTAIGLAAGQGRERVHFYDADITNFDASWIEGAERAADRGFGVVRHRFPRAATDAMITWMITRPALACLFPGTFLPRLNQPLGGEVLLTRPALESLASSAFVRSRSDWGIDTVLTYATSVMGLGLYEHHVRDGKRHALYGSLDVLREMLVECLDAAASLAGKPPPPPGALHGSDEPETAPADLTRAVAYDVEGTRRLLEAEWVGVERDLALRLPGNIGTQLLAHPQGFEFMGAEEWFDAHRFLLDHFVLGDPAWESLAFRLWITRVLAYTTGRAGSGYEAAMDYLESTITRYEELSHDKEIHQEPGRIDHP